MTAPVVSLGEKDLRKFAAALQGLAQGRSNAVGTFTLTASTTSTTVTAPTCAPGSAVFWNATTTHGANDIPLMSYVAGTGQFVVTHANNSRADRSFGFVVLG